MELEQDPDLIDPWMNWLTIAMRSLHSLQQEFDSADQVSFAQASLLLVGVECDVMPPQISFVSMHSSAVRITWSHRNLMVSIEVRCDRSIEITYSVDRNVIARYVHTVDQVEHVRQAVAWIFPQSNCGFPR